MAERPPGGPAADRPGPIEASWTRWLAWRAAYGGGVVGTLGAAGYLLLRAEAVLARRTIGEPTEQAPAPDSRYGPAGGGALRLAVLGDSSAAGLGCALGHQTPGARLAVALSRALGRPVELDVVARVGARSGDLDRQLAVVLQRPPHLAAVLVGANDVTHRVASAQAAQDLGRAVRALRGAGVAVVVGTCPDLGTIKPVLQPLRSLARTRSRALARVQAVAVVENDGVAVSLGDLLGAEFERSPQLFGPDRFHPSPAGYQRLAEALLPPLLRACGAPVPREDPGTVQDAQDGARVAAEHPGGVLEALPERTGVAAPGAGRLTRLRRARPAAAAPAPSDRSGQQSDAH